MEKSSVDLFQQICKKIQDVMYVSRHCNLGGENQQNPLHPAIDLHTVHSNFVTDR